MATFQELLEAQRAVAPRCPHCGGRGRGDSCADRARDQEQAIEAMRTHIRVLEAAWSLELDGAAKA
jgi:hypothetical protein